MRLVSIFQATSFEFCLDLGKCHRKCFRAIDITILLWEVEGLADCLEEIIANYTMPIVEYLICRRHSATLMLGRMLRKVERKSKSNIVIDPTRTHYFRVRALATSALKPQRTRRFKKKKKTRSSSSIAHQSLFLCTIA